MTVLSIKRYLNVFYAPNVRHFLQNYWNKWILLGTYVFYPILFDRSARSFVKHGFVSLSSEEIYHVF